MQIFQADLHICL